MMRKAISLFLSAMLGCTLFISMGFTSFSDTTTDYRPIIAPLTDFAPVQFACQSTTQKPKMYYFSNYSPRVTGRYYVTMSSSSGPKTFESWHSGYVQQIDVPIDTTINIYATFTQGNTLIELRDSPIYPQVSNNGLIASASSANMIDSPLSVDVSAGTYFLWVTAGYTTGNGVVNNYAFSSYVTLGDGNHHLVHCYDGTNKTGCEFDACEFCGQVFNIQHPQLSHHKTNAGLLKNGFEYDKCNSCGQLFNYKTFIGFSKSYVKSFKVIKGTKCFTAKWTKRSNAIQKKFNGYQIRYSTKSNMKNAVKVNAKKSSSSKTIKKLKKNKKYYVQVRTFTKKDGITFYSKWSKKKSVKTR